MIKVYDWDKNILEIDDKYNNHYYLELRGNKNIVKGCSGVGKTYLCDRIRKLKNSVNENSKYDVSNIIVLNKDNKEKLREFKNQLIIIDNAELLLSESDIEQINVDDNNRYLIFARVPIGIEVSPNHQADFLTKHNTTYMEYRFHVKGWC